MPFETRVPVAGGTRNIIHDQALIAANDDWLNIAR
jgi:hypothetical protein